MCGIFAGITRNEPINKYVDHALRQLEYRGYDSWGFLLDTDLHHGVGHRYDGDAMKFWESHSAIAHTRWATNGKATLVNAHPLERKGWYIVHNGIITNAEQLKKKYSIDTIGDTDTEILLDMSADDTIEDSEFFSQIEGHFAFVLKQKCSDLIYAARRSIPLYFVIQNDNKFIVSDLNAAPVGEIKYRLVEENRYETLQNVEVDDTWHTYIVPERVTRKFRDIVTLDEINQELWELQYWMTYPIETTPFYSTLIKSQSIQWVGSGSSYYAAQIARDWLGGVANLPYKLNLNSDATIFFSQSGESFDTIEAAKTALQVGQKVLSITNAPHSRLAQLSHYHLDMDLGIEYGVAATKSFMAQVAIAYYLNGYFRSRRSINPLENVERALKIDYSSRAKQIAQHKSIFILSHSFYPIAQEAALKFKELALIHAEAIPTTEFKHGPLAMIDKDSLVIILGRSEKDEIATRQIQARGGETITLESDVFGLITTVHMLATHTALAKHINPDFPRNLAKAITVE